MEQIDCPAPLPEDPADALLTEMLVPAPYEVSVKKAKKKATGTRKGLQRKVISDSSSENTEAHSSHENEEEEEESSPPPPAAGGTRKGRPPHLGRPKGPRREGPSFRTAPRWPLSATRSGYPETSPWRSRKYPDTIIVLVCFVLLLLIMPNMIMQSIQSPYRRILFR